MTLQQAEKVQKDYCYETLKNSLKEWLQDEIADNTTGLTAEQRQEIVTKLVETYEDSIEHHAEKVLERGLNEGRMEAHCQFLIDDVKALEDDPNYQVFVATQANNMVGRSTFDSDNPTVLILQGLDQDIMPAELCDEVDVPEGSTYAEGRAVLSSPRFDFDWKEAPGRVVAELAPELAKHGLLLEPIEHEYFADTYSFRLRKV